MQNLLIISMKKYNFDNESGIKSQGNEDFNSDNEYEGDTDNDQLIKIHKTKSTILSGSYFFDNKHLQHTTHHIHIKNQNIFLFLSSNL